jgi:DNA-binding GntR family transcriptional regulator
MRAMSSAAPVTQAPHRRGKSRAALGGWLAARIVEHLREQNLEPGSHIVEQRLADHFNVSRTPVRVALAALAESGLVTREPNRGFFTVEASASLSTTDVAPAGDDKLYYRIAEDRLQGRIGQQVTEAELARRYKSPRTTISAVLARMANEGWLERMPWQRWAFQPMLDSVKGYEDGYRFRALIEPGALRQPGYHLPVETIARLRAVQLDFLRDNARYSDAEAFEIGSAFHEALVGASGNSFLLDSLRRVNSVRRLFEYRAKRDRSYLDKQYREHIALLDLIEAGELEQAARLMEKHLGGAGKMKARLVSQPQVRTPRG